MATSKEELVSTIKQWITMDNEIRAKQLEMKKIKDGKKNLSKLLMEVMKTNDIDTFDIKNGALVYKQTTTKAPINKKTLSLVLAKYFKDDDQAAELSKFILDNREETIKESLTRKINKN
jgi:hypothetical protein